MADQEQLEILRQGVDVWNKWREENRKEDVDLSGASLSGIDLSHANFIASNLRDADLHESNLSRAMLDLASLNAADLSSANLGRASLCRANLHGTNLSSAKLFAANFYEAGLGWANFSEAEIDETIFTGALFLHTNFLSAKIRNATFGGCDLRKILNIDTIIHLSSSYVSTDTFQFSNGSISETFLRGCGLTDWEIESGKLYKPNLSNEEIDRILYKIHDLRAQQSIQISPLFISYSHADTSLVQKLETYLLKLGVRFWRDVHNATAGRLETQIDRAMRQNPTVLLILSQNSTASDWVEHEARLARELEKEIGRDVLCPIALDDSWKSAKWPVRLMEQIMEYNILDFSNWQDDASFERTFNKMINGLDMFYKPENSK